MSTSSHPRALALPLHGVRVIELSDKVGLCGRFLADLGAEVILVEPPGGSPARQAPPLVSGVSLPFLVHHANKRSVMLDLGQATQRKQFERLAASADLLIETTRPGTLEPLGLDAASLRAMAPHLVVVSITDFGQSGPYRDYVASNGVHTAMAGLLCRSGLPGMPPLLPPGSLAWQAAAVQATWVALIGYWQRLKTGQGDQLDVSLHETVAQVLDPALGATGSASAGRSALDSTPPGRPTPMPLYPVIPSADGLVRIAVLNPRQWQAMCAWLGDDHPFTDPAYAHIGKRLAESQALNACIADLFKRHPTQHLLQEALRRGIPMAAVATPADVLQDAHFRARGIFQPLDIAEGVVGQVPTGFVELDGMRAGLRSAPAAPGADNEDLLSSLPPAPAATTGASGGEPFQRRPLEGLRVLDLGVIVAGAECGRLFADQGADVIKVENRAFPDGGRQSAVGDLMTPSIAYGHRNKRSLGLNLRSEQGKAWFLELVRQSDVVLSNFKPGTLESLGLGHEVLKAANPRIVTLESSALGRTGPFAKSLGYGPLVRASTGMTWLWSYPDVPQSFSDGVTIFPDHAAARVAAVAVLAQLIGRERSGLGGHVAVSQAEVFLVANAEHFLRESIEPGSFVPRGNDSEFSAPDGVFRCAGEDQWCVISVRDDADWERFAAAIGRTDLLDDVGLRHSAGRIARRGEINALTSAWTANLSPHEVTQTLQRAGVPAGFMCRLSEFRTDPQFAARTFIRELVHPGLKTTLPAENRQALSTHQPAPDMRPAPYQAEHTRQIAQELLGLDVAQIDAAIAAGDLEEGPGS